MRRILLTALILIALVVVVYPRVSDPLSQRTRRIIDELNSPVAVKGWDDTGLLLADNRKLLIPGISNLPTASPALSEVTKRGIEIDNTERVWGLARVWHWCGNDPVREHLARVDLTNMLTFLRIGSAADKSSLDLIPPDVVSQKGDFTEYGWNYSEYYAFESWSKFAHDLKKIMDGPEQPVH